MIIAVIRPILRATNSVGFLAISKEKGIIESSELTIFVKITEKIIDRKNSRTKKETIAKTIAILFFGNLILKTRNTVIVIDRQIIIKSNSVIALAVSMILGQIFLSPLSVR